MKRDIVDKTVVIIIVLDIIDSLFTGFSILDAVKLALLVYCFCLCRKGGEDHAGR